jgi:hypothetical protein
MKIKDYIDYAIYFIGLVILLSIPISNGSNTEEFPYSLIGVATITLTSTLVAFITAKFIKGILMGVISSFFICEILLVLIYTVSVFYVTPPDFPVLAILPFVVLIIPLYTGVSVLLISAGSIRILKRKFKEKAERTGSGNLASLVARP